MAYNFHMPNSGVLSFMLEMLMHIMESYAEIPGGIYFENLVLNLQAAMHPPTYVHSQMVAEISVCLCRHLIETHPELLIGVEGYASKEEVTENKSKVLDYTLHAALLHDTGKICIIDTVFVYGRKLLDLEFELIKTHPRMGAMMLGKYESTRKYADVALGHHKWHDDSCGYPEEFRTKDSPVKGVIDIVQCADCLDASTDTVGRSYSAGKTYDEFCEEVREGSGSRYAPWLHELLTRPEVKKDIERILSEEREMKYRYTYQLLKSVQDNEYQ